MSAREKVGNFFKIIIVLMVAYTGWIMYGEIRTVMTNHTPVPYFFIIAYVFLTIVFALKLKEMKIIGGDNHF